ncbi:MAG: hypothetical protein A2233_03140 [Candidatus Kerfeldbacteria bacterium RIFOXYA2_FULL_38_24]|uniref:AbiEi antitoxin C-terminal domain-containing protein n=1 Tax=Candidatus Kerfeldbacteria bacterium RIFOXYB2_FULL_38_14 TaxID=1798547 RepID=A0A1G2BAK8_9BACT|nr:MAG: hypothetical protein A2233_03140 [Candidatus Kerfeldbacteria bacterium RIFOXYA2_FULL_38_24]OGY86191.1 MAG: hypothetical protein A2319_03340 [Candidatus Kerfeldbacteria bacterium RIFOXYB2_FULL_38_14]
MRNNNTTPKNRIDRIMRLVAILPYFTIDDLVAIEKNRDYLKILFGRYVKNGQLIRLKKGMYVTRAYVDNLEKKQLTNDYHELLANILYPNAYLSTEYILQKYQILTEVPTTITAISTAKTKNFNNYFGNFIYHSIKPSLFFGLSIKTVHGWQIKSATLAKALFDYLYLRKNNLQNKQMITELRLNTDLLKLKDKKELLGYIKREGSKRMAEIYKNLF